ncbi:Disks large homolog 5 [Lemmus lemmus]
MNKVDELTLELQMMTNERNELRAILASYTNNDVTNRLNSELEELKMDHQKEMSDVKKFHKEISEGSYKRKELTEKINSYRTLHSRLLREWTQMKEKVGMLKEDKRKLKEEQIFLQKSCEEAKRLCDEAQEQIYDLWAKQQKGHQRLGKHLQSSLKQKELASEQKDLAVKLQHHFTVSQMRSEHLQHELEQTTAQEESLPPMELLQQECCVPANTS